MQSVILYIKPTCPFCMKAMEFLKKENIPFRTINILDNPQLRDEMIQKSNGRTTVPEIFFGSHHVGGCDDLLASTKEQRKEWLSRS